MRMICVLAVTLVLLAAPLAAEAYDQIVNPFGSCSISGTPEYNTLQDAIDAANPGDSIGVCPGTHDVTSPVNVNKSVTITGIGTATVEASSSTVSCLNVTAADVTIRYLTIRGCNAGIGVAGTGALIQNNRLQLNHNGLDIRAQNAIVQNNLFEDNSNGVLVAGFAGNVAGTTIKNNTLHCGDGSGIFLNQATGAIVTKNSLQACHEGIGSTSSSDTTFSFNNVSAGDEGFVLSNMGSNNQVTRNIVTRNSFRDCRWDGNGGVTFSKNTCGTEIPAGAWD